MILLGACSHTKIESIPTFIPTELRECQELPTVPGAGARQSDVAVYVTDLHQTATECKTKLNGIDKILDDIESGDLTK